MSDAGGPKQFMTTQWSLVDAALADTGRPTQARAALETLCRTYWYPLYAFVRSRGHTAPDAQDLTQAFFARLLESRGLAGADPARGRFRSYLLGALKHFLANEWHRARARKRGGRVQLVAWDAVDPEARYATAARVDDDPEMRFDREWALQIVATALDTLGRDMAQAGRSAQFEALKGSLTGEDRPPRADLAARLQLSDTALKVAIHRLRRRFRTLLREAVAQTVRSEADLEEEMLYLVAVLRRG